MIDNKPPPKIPHINKLIRYKDRFDFVYKYLSVMNIFYSKKTSLSKRELEILSHMVSIPEAISHTKLCRTARKIIRTKGTISTSNLTNVINTLETKGYVLTETVEDTDIRYVKRDLVPAEETVLIRIGFSKENEHVEPVVIENKEIISTATEQQEVESINLQKEIPVDSDGGV